MDRFKLIQDYVDSLIKKQMNDDQQAALLESDDAMKKLGGTNYLNCGNNTCYKSNYSCPYTTNDYLVCSNMDCPGGTNRYECYNSGGCTPSTVNSGQCSNNCSSCYYG